MSETKSLPRVLCVDDEVNILKSLQRTLMSPSWELMFADSGAKALEIMGQLQVDVIVSDMKMPGMTGAELLEQVAQSYPNSYRILLSGYADNNSLMAAINQGKIQRYLQKPWSNEELKICVQDGLEQVRLQRQNKLLQQQLIIANKQLKSASLKLEEQVNQRTAQLRASLLQMRQEQAACLTIMFDMLSSIPNYQTGFAQNVSDLCLNLATRLKLSKSDIEFCGQAGLLHEIGYVRLAPEVLAKAFTPMQPLEHKDFLQHVLHGKQLLSASKGLNPVALMIYHQYEAYSGSGHPEHLLAANIPIGSRILAVARDYWAWLMGRRTSEAVTPGDAFQRMNEQAKKLYDPDILRELRKIAFHVGSALQADPKQGISLRQLAPGMVLKFGLYDNNKQMLLPEGHVFTAQSVKDIQTLGRDMNPPLLILVHSPTHDAVKVELSQAELDKALVTPDFN